VVDYVNPQLKLGATNTSPLWGFEILDCLFSIIISSLTGLVFSGLDFKVAKSRTLAPAPDCSGNPFADFSSAKDWNVKRG